MAWTPFNAYLSNSLATYWGGATAPNPTNFRLVLCNAGALSETSDIAAIDAAKIANTNGYNGGVLLTGYSIAFDAGQARAEVTFDPVVIAASGGNITYDAIVIVANAPTADISAAVPVLFQNYGTAETVTNGLSLSITPYINHGGAAADVEAA